MMRVDYSFSRIAKYIFLGYLCVSVVYILHRFYDPNSQKGHTVTPRNPAGHLSQLPMAKTPRPHNWPNSEEPVEQQYLFSKLFSESMQPTNLIPYYYKMDPAPPKKEITVATLITSDRFHVFEKLVRNYKGPISVALHVSDDNRKDGILDRLAQMYETNPLMKQYVDVHLIVDKYERQFNYWRNVARFFSRTDYFLLLDIDFYLCTDFRKNLDSYPELMERLEAGQAAIVLPAFEYNVLDEGRDAAVFPKTKEDLLELVQDERIDMFHKSWQRGHGSTNYTNWYQSEEPYMVTDYNYSYEPYVIVKKDGVPWCNERFIGYGGNKAACLYEIYLSGVEYWILPNDYIIHQNHDYPLTTRKIERNLNKKIYENFREEACFRYFRNMVASGAWGTPKGENLRRECTKSVASFQKVVDEFQP
ncbi:hypothetical protein K7432_005024 [Basidiobolus ranarum]|uniref:Glycosyltransferase family 49 protein n=1 Tax=Basidiobolus ranarum TaxID=34480 RepID=A0ABR2WXE0_9FUNG